MKWISVIDRLPDPGQSFIGSDGKEIHTAHWCNDTDQYYSGGWGKCYYCGGRSHVRFEYYCDSKRSFLVTHWMPLPKLPKEK